MAGMFGGGGSGGGGSPPVAQQPAPAPAAAPLAPQRRTDDATLAAQRLRFYGAGDNSTTGTGGTSNTKASTLVRFLGNAGGT